MNVFCFNDDDDDDEMSRLAKVRDNLPFETKGKLKGDQGVKYHTNIG